MPTRDYAILANSLQFTFSHAFVAIYLYVTLMYISPSISVLFFHDAIAPIFSSPPNHLDFTITLRHTTFGRTPMDG